MQFLSRSKVSLALLSLGLAALAPYANRDAISYAIKPDASYHRFTWFYPTYDWINHKTPGDERFLVIVSSGQSYYLDRRHRRADPWLSGVVDWRKVSTGQSLDSVLSAGGYRYVVYEDTDWSPLVGGQNAMNAIGDASRSGLLKKIAVFDDTLYTSRLRKTYLTTKVDVFERATSSGRR